MSGVVVAAMVVVRSKVVGLLAISSCVILGIIVASRAPVLLSLTSIM